MMFADIAAGLLTIVALVLLVPVAVLFIEVVASFIRRRPAEAPLAVQPRIAVLMPAHNEALNIQAAIGNLRPQLAASDRLFVVADNCSDETAVLARAAGAEVIERQNATQRGKGFALDFGLRHLASAAPDIVVIVDADCRVDPGSLARIAGLAMATGRPVQARYELAPGGTPVSPLRAVATFAWRVKNIVRPLGYRALGLPCQLMGTGMAFPWAVIRTSDLATSEIVEDLVHGLELARDGHPPLYCPEAVVSSEFPATTEGEQSQRARWETGHLNTIANVLPRMLGGAVRRRNMPLLALVLDASVPPLAFLALTLMGFCALAALFAVASGETTSLKLAIIGLFTFACAVLLAWWQVGREILSIHQLALVPMYAFSKLDLYGRILRGRKVAWIRTRRDRG